MSSSPERPAGTPGSTVGYEQGQATGRETAGREYGREYPPAGRHEAGEHRGAMVGFTALAGTLMVLGGLWGVVVGIAALSSNHVFVVAPNSNYTYHWSVSGWGWAELILGIVIFAAGVSVFLGMAWARYLGAALAVISAIGNFMFIPFTPVWSIIMIVLDAFI
ncbi:MAG TPA: hypothetical protein VF834_06875, partial [Streptosporangiaceae bacterium]